jgi:hypothetical protein
MCTVLLQPGINPIAVNKYNNINISINVNIISMTRYNIGGGYGPGVRIGNE